MFEALVIICSVLIVGGVFGKYVYRKIKKLPVGDCACCKKVNGKPKWVELYRKDNPKQEICDTCK